MHAERLENADFDAFLSAYDYDRDADPATIDWQDIYRYDPDLADVAIVDYGAFCDALAASLATTDPEIRVTNWPQVDAGRIAFDDGTATTCPYCRGELEYHNRVAVTCPDCEAAFDHFYTTVRHELCTTNDDETKLETVATAPIDSEHTEPTEASQ